MTFGVIVILLVLFVFSSFISKNPFGSQLAQSYRSITLIFSKSEILRAELIQSSNSSKSLIFHSHLRIFLI